MAREGVPLNVIQRKPLSLARETNSTRTMMRGPPALSAQDAPLTGSSPIGRPQARPYLIWSYTLNIGMYMATMMKPTIAPTTTIMSGSRIEVSDLTAVSTWSS